MGIYQDNKDAMEFFRNSKQLESNGKWQEFVEQSELEAAVHEPRNMAHGGRIGFEPGGHVTSQELKKVMANAGITPSHSNFSKVVKDLGVKVEKASTQPIYIEPTKKELIIKKKKWDENQLKSSFESKTGKAAFEKRKARIIDLILEGELTQQEIENTLRSETGLASKKTIQNVKEELGVKIVSGRERGPKNPKTAKIITDLNILKNSEELNNLILKSDFNLMKDLPELEKIATKALPKTTADPVRRVGQLLLAYSGEDPELQKYVGEVSDDLVKASGVVKTKMNKSSRLLSTLQKIASEKRAAGELGKDPAFFGSQRKRLGEIVNSLKKGLGLEVDEIRLEVDEIKPIGGAKAKTPAYNLFVQGVKDTVNQKKGETLDRLTQTAELELQNEKKISKKIKIANKYNKEVKDFVANANKNLKPGQLPVRALEISFDPPSETIKNKAAYNEYKPYFDDVYTKHKYSFKVPKDVMTSEQAKIFLKTDKGQAQLLKQIDLGSQRLYSFPANLAENSLSKFGKLGKGIKLFAKGEALFAPLFLYGGAAYGLPFTRNINEASYGILGKSKSEYLINKSPKAKKVIDLLDAEAKYNTLLEKYNKGSAMDKMWFKDEMLAKQKEFEEKVAAFNAIPEEEKMELGQAYQTAEQNYEDEIKQRRDRHFSNYIIPKKEFFTDIGSNISDAFTAPVSANENVFGTFIPAGKVQTEFAKGGIADLTRTVARDSEGIMSLKK